MEIEVETTVEIVAQGIAIGQTDVIATIDLKDDGFGDLSWSLTRIEIRNITGTGRARWDHKDIEGDALGDQLWRAVQACDHVNELACEAWKEAGYEEAA